MRIALADPPYLGRAARWYGLTGRGSGGGRHRPDGHPAAAEWDRPERHLELVAQLREEFDAWAVAACPASLPVYLSAAPRARVMIWRRRNAPPSGARVRSCWEPVILETPRRAQGTGHSMDDVLDAAGPRIGFAGAKPAAWTRWVLDAIGYDAATDEVTDLFAGSGRVAAELAQGVLL
jgi:hypothetical protein